MAEEAVLGYVSGTAKVPATQGGMIIGFGSLVVMALISIFLDSFQSVNYQN